MAQVKSQYKKRLGNLSCWQWQCRHIQSLQEGTGNEEGNEGEGCDSERKNSLGPSIENKEEGQDKVGKRMTMRMRKDANEDDSEGSIVEGGQGG